MAILVVGATGATGKLLVKQLLDRGQAVKAVVRNPASLPQKILEHENLTVVKATLLDLSDEELANLARGCDAVASCLGHTLSFRGILGLPYRLVTEAARRLCNAISANQPALPVKYVLMNTTGNRNLDLSEKVSFAQHCVLSLLRLLIPPHADNEQAANYLRTQVGQDHGQVEWCVVRPDTLIDESDASGISTHYSPIRSAIFDAGETSRINVACFMADLITNDALWSKWKGHMPVIYNQ